MGQQNLLNESDNFISEVRFEENNERIQNSLKLMKAMKIMTITFAKCYDKQLFGF